MVEINPSPAGIIAAPVLQMAADVLRRVFKVKNGGPAVAVRQFLYVGGAGALSVQIPCALGLIGRNGPAPQKIIGKLFF